MEQYDHRSIEKKWQKIWEEKKQYEVNENSNKPKFYSLVEFPYPSAEGLHVGHVRSYTAMDIVSRKKRRDGFEVLYPMGFDAFGLPAENYAVKTGVHPKITTEKAIKNYRKQLKSMGLSFDWSREFATTDPEYYKWTQWIFLQLFKKGLAYKKKMLINWCADCKIGLANEEVVGGLCERCGKEVEKREKEQWMLAITKYADRLLDDLELLDYIEPVKAQQRNWIGKSEGLLFSGKVKGLNIKIQTFSTHFEAFYADTFVVIAPDHPLLLKLVKGVKEKEEILSFSRKIINKRMSTREDLEVEGIFTGRYFEDPISKTDLPIWVASYAIADYGTGIVKASCHDERDFAFAKKYKIHLKPVLFPEDPKEKKKIKNLEICFTDMENGMLSEPDVFSGKRAGTLRKEIADYAEKEGFAEKKTVYKLRDWVFSRQRYWGEPIPMILCPKCGPTPVPESDLPVELPDVKDFLPSEDGESPLSKATDWVDVKCPKCGESAKRETDVMPNWAGSSWYFLRYIDPKNPNALVDKKKEKKWMPVDWYNGGMEHTTLHLLYSRFWHKFLYDIGVVTTSEPYQKRTSHGFILGEDGDKMSKSRGNVINPDDVVEHFGADTLRIYEMFIGPFNQAIAWSTDGLMGPRRFLDKVWRLSKNVDLHNSDTTTLIQPTIKKVSDDIDNMKFNTAISSLMIYVNQFTNKTIPKLEYKILLQILAPFAPHITEELWEKLGEKESIHLTAWPAYDRNKAVQKRSSVVVQINGKVRDQLDTEDFLEESVIKKALALPRVKERIKGKKVERVIYIEGKLLNIVLSEF